MALNSDQLIDRFLKIAYPIDPKCTCMIEINTMKMLRQNRRVKIQGELKAFPEKDKRDVINKMIEKEEQNTTCQR